MMMYFAVQIDLVEGRNFALNSAESFLVLHQTVVDWYFDYMTKFEDMLREPVALPIDKSFDAFNSSFATFSSPVFGDR